MNSHYEPWVDILDKFTNQLIKFYKTDIESDTLSYNRKKIGPIELALLDLFESGGPLTVKEVINNLKVPNSTVTSIINRLESQKILKRNIHPNDKRTFFLSLTTKGNDLLNQRRLEKRQLFYYILGSLENESEREYLINMITRLSKSLETVNEDLLRRIHMDILKKEYDAFGPWINEIKDETEIPPQFSRESTSILSANYAIKIPRNIERRDASAGMPLYDQVICLYDDELRIFTRLDNRVDTASIPYKEIRYIQKVNDLLFGELVILANNNEYSFHYNSISNDLVDDIVVSLRDKYYTNKPVIDISQIEEHAHIKTAIFRNLVAKEMKNEEVKLIEYQSFIELTRQKTTTIQFLIDLYDKPCLQDSLFMTNGKELIILSRIKEVKREHDSDYGYKHTFIPIEYISDISHYKDSDIENLQNLEFLIDQSKFTIKVGDSFDSTELKSILNK